MNRARTHPAIISYSLYLYYSSRSFRLAARCLSSLIQRSHVAIWKWVQRYAFLADRFRIDRRKVKQIFVDETLVKVDGLEYWLWVAYEPSLDVCLMMHLSRERTILVCYQFFKQLRNRYGRRPIFTDGAHWYNTACRWLNLPHQMYATEMKNMMMMERFIHSTYQGQNWMFWRPLSLQEVRLRQAAYQELAEIICTLYSYEHG